MLFISMKTFIECVCHGCGKPFQKLASYVRRSKTGIHYCSTSCQLLIAKESSLTRRLSVRREYEKMPNRCLNCNTPIDFRLRKNRFCCRRCAATYNQRDGGHGGTHIWTTDERLAQSEKMKNVGRKSITETRVCEHCGQSFIVKHWSKKRFCSRKCADVGRDLSRAGGYRQRGGRGKQGWYKGIFCGSSWELAWVIFQLEHGVNFSRNDEGFQYIYQGVSHKYYPDFLMTDGEYVEVKGYNSPQWEAKRMQFPHKLSVIDKVGIRPYLNYVVEKYGDDFTRLYEDANVA